MWVNRKSLLVLNKVKNCFILHFSFRWLFDSDGDLGYYGDVRAAFFKQKHRMIWERRHGKIGSGRKQADDA